MRLTFRKRAARAVLPVLTAGPLLAAVNVDFSSYVYDEYEGGAATNEGLTGVHGSDVPCA